MLEAQKMADSLVDLGEPEPLEPMAGSGDSLDAAGLVALAVHLVELQEGSLAS